MYIEKESSRPKILSDADWSDKEWSDERDSSDEEEGTTKPLETVGDDPPIFFGLPAQDIGSQTRLNSGTAQKSAGVFPVRKITPIAMETRVEHTTQRGGAGGGEPSSWNNLLQPCKKYLAQLRSQFPEEWFGYVAGHINNGNAEDAHDDVQLDTYRDIVMYCYAVVNICGLHGSLVHAGPAHINKVFQDRIPWSPELDLLEQDNGLKELVLKAYR